MGYIAADTATALQRGGDWPAVWRQHDVSNPLGTLARSSSSGPLLTDVGDAEVP